MKTKLYLLIVLLSVYNSLKAQVSVSPYFPTEKDTVKMVFDAAAGNAALANADTIIYAHTAVITNLSASTSDWRYLKFPWGTNDPSVLLKPLGNNKFLLSFPRSVKSFYGVPAGENITYIALVFRNKNGTLVGKTADNKDILVPIYDGSLHAKILRPAINSSSPFLDSANTVLNVLAAASQKSNLSIFLNNKVVKTGYSDTLSVALNNFPFGTNWIRVNATNGTTVVSDSVFFINVPQPQVLALPAGTRDGITYTNDSTVIFNLYAPGKKSIYVIGDFNNFAPKDKFFMNITPDNARFWLKVSGLQPGKEYAYQYFIDKNLKVADPYAEKVLDPGNDKYIPASVYPNPTPYPANANRIVSVLQTGQKPYPWAVQAFVKPKKTDLVIYELHMRDFLETHNYQTLKDTLNYLKKLGINAIELMPINEFEGNDSWGYNPDFYLAPDKYYGTRNALKAFIDKAHTLGIAVIMDIALNHSFGQSPMAQMYWDKTNSRPAADNPWFNPTPTHPFNVGNDFNHQSPATKYLVRNVISYWVKEYKIDGYRFDLSKGFTQKVTTTASAFSALDTARVAIWKGIANFLWKNDPTTYVILEHLADNTEEKILANYGMMLWGNLNFSYGQASMGFTANNTSDLSWAYYKNRGWNNPNIVSYMESHDEDRMLYRNLKFGAFDSLSHYFVKDTATAHARAGLAAAFFFSIPGPKMIWEFEELGYDYSIDFNGRAGKKPIRWDYYKNIDKRKLFNIYAAMIKLKISQPAFRTQNVQQNTNGTFKNITLLDSTMNVNLIGNFGVVKGSMNPYFPNSGTWYDYFKGDSIVVTDIYAKITLAPGEYRLFTTRRLPRPEMSLIGAGLNEKNDGMANDLNLTSFPNPAATTSTIGFDLQHTNSVSIRIFNIVGEEVKSFAPEKYTHGYHSIEWDLKNSTGMTVPAGVYFINILAGDNTKTAKLLVNP